MRVKAPTWTGLGHTARDAAGRRRAARWGRRSLHPRAAEQRASRHRVPRARCLRAGQANGWVGTITNLLVDVTGRLVGVILDVDESLGGGAREVAISFEALLPVR